MKLSLEEYHRTEALSKSNLDKLAISPLHFKHSKENPPAPTPAMIFGAAYHLAGLEPQEFSKFYAIAPEGIDRRTKAGKEAWAEFEQECQGKTVITREDRDKISLMIEVLYAHETVQKLLTNGIPEDSLFADMNGVPGKCRPDYKRPDIGVLIDLKSAVDASPKGFSKAIANYNYHIQSAWYLDLVNLAETTNYEQFVFIVQEKEPPFAVAVYVADYEMIEMGRLRYEELLMVYKFCRDNDVWPGYPDKVQIISLPGWAKY